jgi:hypothetical protein
MSRGTFTLCHVALSHYVTWHFHIMSRGTFTLCHVALSHYANLPLKNIYKWEVASFHRKMLLQVTKHDSGIFPYSIPNPFMEKTEALIVSTSN